jgi:hypothetical protein
MLSLYRTATELSPAQSENAWKKTQQVGKSLNYWILGNAPLEGKTHQDIFLKLFEKGTTFKGFFHLHNFPDKAESALVKFVMVGKESTIGQMKEAIEKITGISKDTFFLCFKSLAPLDNDQSLYLDLYCHGRGGEIFHLYYNPGMPQPNSRSLHNPFLISN